MRTLSTATPNSTFTAMTTMFQRGVTLTLMMLMVSSSTIIIGALEGPSETTTTPGQNNQEQMVEELKTTLTGLQEKIAAWVSRCVEYAFSVTVPGRFSSPPFSPLG